jgi:undecaprenyl-diphosphatase
MAFTFCIAAGIYCVLALHRLRYWQTVLVEVATAFVNRLLPSGIGGLGIHGVYLFKQKHTGAEATVVVSVNNLLGMGAHLLLLAGAVTYNLAVLHRFTAGSFRLDWRIGVAVGLLAGVVFAVSPLRGRTASFVRHMLVSVRKISMHKIVTALLLAMLLTVVYTLVLVCTARSLGLQLSVLQVFVVFSIGMLTSTVTPTPGGLVGAEAGLFAGFVAYGVASPTAGAAVLLYRLVTYWLPLLPGAFALLLARRRRLV